jgi:hypothetical protein
MMSEQNELQDNAEMAYMHRRTLMEAYGEQMAKMLATLSSKNGDESDPAQLEMVKEAFVEMMAPKPALPAMMYPPPPMPIRSPIFRHTEGGKSFIYRWDALINDNTHVERDDASGHVTIWNRTEEVLALHGAAAADFWQYVNQAIDQQEARYSPPASGARAEV